MNPSSSICPGIWPVMITPFDATGKVDWPAYEALIEYYIEEEAAGIFAVCTSSEFLHLTQSEIVELARKSVKWVRDRIGVIATGNLGDTLSQQIEMMDRVADTGVNATVIATSLLPRSDAIFEQILRITEKTDYPLGIYESPIPEHRTLTVSEVYEAAASGRFVALKETSRDLPTFLEKVRRSSGSPLNVFQANLRILLDSGNFYGAGFMGCLANTFPRLIGDYMTRLRDPASDMTAIRGFLLDTESVLYGNRYPASAKYVLNRLGVPIQPNCRWLPGGSFDESNRADLDRFIARIQSFLSTNDRVTSLRLPDAGLPETLSDMLVGSVDPPID